MNSIRISLPQKILSLLNENGEVIRQFPIIYGRNSHFGRKERENDQRTPIGRYYVCTINKQSKFGIFFGISYPNEEDAIRGFERGIINEDQKRSILEALEKKLRPPWDTPLGGEIGIHGGGIERDGTRGCIGMKDEDAMELKKFVEKGMEVIIVGSEMGEQRMESPRLLL